VLAAELMVAGGSRAAVTSQLGPIRQ
jgi:hypothetical protein